MYHGPCVIPWWESGEASVVASLVNAIGLVVPDQPAKHRSTSETASQENEKRPNRSKWHIFSSFPAFSTISTPRVAGRAECVTRATHRWWPWLYFGTPATHLFPPPEQSRAAGKWISETCRPVPEVSR
ncbi:hypothetical protein MRX96_059737 [Rhipicephalus microplus]